MSVALRLPGKCNGLAAKGSVQEGDDDAILNSGGKGPQKSPQRDLFIASIGEFGKYQFCLYLSLALMVIIHSWQMFSMKFLTYKVDFWCSKPSDNPFYRDFSDEQWRNVSGADKCTMLDVNWSLMNHTERPAFYSNGSLLANATCDDVTFDSAYFQYTAAERFGLVSCGADTWDPAILDRIAQTVFFLGNMIGVFTCGIAADYFGRKPVLLFSLALFIASGTIASFVFHFYAWLALKFLMGAATLSLNTCISVMISETCSTKYRPYIHAFTSGLFWTLGHIILGLVVYLLPNMTEFELFISASGVVFLPLGFVLPESPRWLLAKGRFAEAEAIIAKIQSFNGRTTKLNDEELNTFRRAYVETPQEKVGVAQLVRIPGIRRNFLAMCFCWLGFSMGYFGLLYNTPTKKDAGIYWVFILPGIIGLPVCFVLPWMQKRFGRKFLLTLPLISAGIYMLAMMGVSKEQTTTIAVLSTLGTLGCGAAFDTGYLFTKELFPTVLRTTALSTASAAARIGSILSPLIGALDQLDPLLPIGIYGAVVLFAGLQSVLLWPDTKTVQLPDSVEEARASACTPNQWLRGNFRTNKVAPGSNSEEK